MNKKEKQIVNLELEDDELDSELQKLDDVYHLA